MQTGRVLVSFSSSFCNYFMVALAWRHCSCSLSNSILKYLSDLLITYSDVNFFSMASVSVIYLSHFILSISLKCSALFNTLFWSMWYSPFFACSACSISFDTIYFSLATHSSAYFQENSSCFTFMQKINMHFQPSLWCICILFHLIKICVIFYLDFLWFIDSGGSPLKQLLNFILFFLDQ